MRKFLFTFSLLALCAFCGRTVAQTESTSSATITFFRTPSSLLPGKFSVSATKKVSFARGNLQYLASRNLWRFAEHQYDMIGNAPGNSTIGPARATQGTWIDLFCWGTSGWAGGDPGLSGKNTYLPWSYSTDFTDFGPTIAHMPQDVSWGDNEATKNYDWGTYNFTGELDRGYYVLTYSEWDYILSKRDNASKLVTHGAVYGIKGVFLLPDNWNWADPTIAAAVSAAGFTWVAGEMATTSKNRIANTAAGRALWSAMQAAGAVFLPSTGYVDSEGAVIDAGAQARYHTSTAYDAKYMYSLSWTAGSKVNVSSGGGRYIGRAIRLAKPVAGE